ncbi:DNA polymerase III subunit gamma/tau [Larsenimonas rhizosphaerae]|uniref:DNA polymerase III subunit gamma/tau n=1 Tax=Larsenimonas rhizosphaerae TaxID=2944682 RepID=UPI00203459A8|nr:DNA polymerase III subunit gamma/tau [Larsenimonas rhizosphaerae]MCM2132005.1 DNA polymerase III subunit gamma/tau [Larsenimonas rhizosphaerae]
MSYQVLARKWRPRTFHELVGQEHVSRALINALDQERLHHAYLFTGTRGVGKTTLARILAKCLNCEQGVSSTPCGVCETCREIDEGRFVDLIEVDAASRTRVEDTRELLDNVQYAPTQGRYKVYLVDEVHMLSTHSFNALLKTLEEPPPHVKFLLATTDPQKLPVTVLSRCLQFSLKHMPPEKVVSHLTYVLGQEGVSFDERALWLLGRAANGSMRDALSLTDQAIAFGHGRVEGHDVATMLGTLDHHHVMALAEALAAMDARRLLAEIAELAEQGPDFSGVLDEMTGLFHRLAIAQMVPDAVDNAHGDREAVIDLATRFTAEDVQLYYQMALQGRVDMNQAPEPRAALEMTLLRMLAFRPQGVPRPAETPLPITAPSQAPVEHSEAGRLSHVPEPAAALDNAPPLDEPDTREAAEGTSSPFTPPAETTDVSAGEVPEPPPWSLDDDTPDWQDVPSSAHDAAVSEDDATVADATLVPSPEPAPITDPRPAPLDEAPSSDEVSTVSGNVLDHAAWLALFRHLSLSGLTANLVAHCALGQDDGHTLTLLLDPSQSAMLSEVHRDRLERALSAVNTPRRVIFDVEAVDNAIETPKRLRDRLAAERQARAVDALRRDPHIQSLEQAFEGRLIETSVVSFEPDA